MLSFSSISHPQVLLRACPQPFSAQPVSVLWIAPVQVQSLTLGLAELQQNKHCQYSMNVWEDFNAAEPRYGPREWWGLCVCTCACMPLLANILMSFKMPLLATYVQFGSTPTCWAHMLWICRQREPSYASSLILRVFFNVRPLTSDVFTQALCFCGSPWSGRYPCLLQACCSLCKEDTNRWIIWELQPPYYPVVSPMVTKTLGCGFITDHLNYTTLSLLSFVFMRIKWQLNELQFLFR